MQENFNSQKRPKKFKRKSKKNKIGIIIEKRAKEIAGKQLKLRVNKLQNTIKVINIQLHVICLKDLKQTFRNEVTAQDELEVFTLKNQRNQQQEIYELKLAFNKLTDKLGEELNKLRINNQKELKKHQKLNDKKFTSIMEEVQLNSDSLTGMEGKIMGQVQQNQRNNVSVQKQMVEQLKQYNEKIEQFALNDKLLFEKLKVIANDNTQQIELLNKESQNALLTVNESELAIQTYSANIQQMHQMITDVDEKYKAKNTQLIENITDNQMEIKTLNESYKNDSNTFYVIQDIQDNFRKSLAQVMEKIDVIEQNEVQRALEIQNIATSLQMEVQENLQDLANIHKSSSNQIITDFENALQLVNDDIQKLFKQIDVVANDFKNQTHQMFETFEQKERKNAKKLEMLNLNVEHIRNQTKFQQYKQF